MSLAEVAAPPSVIPTMGIILAAVARASNEAIAFSNTEVDIEKVYENSIGVGIWRRLQVYQVERKACFSLREAASHQEKPDRSFMQKLIQIYIM
jgi:hypothetical protein